MKPCFLFERLVRASNKDREQVLSEMSKIVGIITGDRLVEQSDMGLERHVSLTEFYARGAERAKFIKPFLNGCSNALDYGGGIGRISKHLPTPETQVTVVDVNPLMMEYGRLLCPNVTFKLLEEDHDQYDLCFSVAVFFHLQWEEQKAAFQYIHDHLKPEGRAIVDMLIESPGVEHSEKYYAPPLSEVMNFLKTLFVVKKGHIFNATFFLRKP